ncbi:hypothetical protein DSO57_1013416 [Entomophthora muscae]|uniref:Uncharacterized protein n=1 Tax=Entomophthora muscae TaxID=34485 RepID=A0ACC2TST7_9FUNG|nr:hypothetical protein DSO57_1013416 [Entomophthora muscae]
MLASNSSCLPQLCWHLSPFEELARYLLKSSPSGYTAQESDKVSPNNLNWWMQIPTSHGKSFYKQLQIGKMVPGANKHLNVINDISILVLKTQESNPSSLKADQALQDRPRPANPLNHRLKLLNYPATRRPATEDSLNSCQSAAKLVPMKTHTCKGDVTWLKEVGEGPTSNLPNTDTGVLKPTLETLESNPDPSKTTQITQSGQETAHLLNCKTKLMSYSETHQSPKDNSPNGHQIDANLEPPKIWTYAEVVACLKEVKTKPTIKLSMTASNCQPSIQNG